VLYTRLHTFRRAGQYAAVLLPTNFIILPAQIIVAIPIASFLELIDPLLYADPYANCLPVVNSAWRMHPQRHLGIKQRPGRTWKRATIHGASLGVMQTYFLQLGTDIIS
jgi:hypothetical protein